MAYSLIIIVVKLLTVLKRITNSTSRWLHWLQYSILLLTEAVHTGHLLNQPINQSLVYWTADNYRNRIQYTM